MIWEVKVGKVKIFVSVLVLSLENGSKMAKT